MSLNINLLHQHKVSKLTQRIVVTIRVASIVAGLVVLISLASLFVLKKTTEARISAQTLQKSQIMSRIVKNQDKEAGALLLNQKFKQIQLVSKAEPPFLDYYQTLFATLPNSSESGRIASIIIQKNSSTTVQLTFPNILAMTKFLSTIESEDFKKSFIEVVTSNISFSGDGSKELFFTLNVKF